MAFRFSKEFKVGIFGIIAVSILYLGFNYLKGEDFFKNNKKYYAIYENIDGLTVSNSVFVKGLTVGRVSNISYQQNKGRIVVEMDINGDLILGDSTIAYLRSQSFLGGKAIELRIPEKIENPKKAGDTLRSALAMGMLESITQKTLPVAEDVGALLRKFSAIIDSLQTTEALINSTIIDLHRTLNTIGLTINENRINLRNSLNNIDSITLSIKNSTRQLEPLLENTNAVVDSLQAANLAETITSIRQAVENLNQTLQDLNNGEGTAGKLLKNDSLYVHLNSSADNLNKLLIDMREHPKRYVHFSVFGKKDK